MTNNKLEKQNKLEKEMDIPSNSEGFYQCRTLRLPITKSSSLQKYKFQK